jgi:hypothetical protein
VKANDDFAPTRKGVEKKKSPTSGFASSGYSGQGGDVTAPGLFG